MNPFIESTVARPLGDDPVATRVVAVPVAASKRRSFYLGSTMRAVGLVAGGAIAALSLPGLAHAVDVNTATQSQLMGVRGLGPKTAQVIIEERSRGGRYISFEDLSDRVKGIGPKKAATLQASGLTVGSAGADQPALSTVGARPAPVANALKSPKPAAAAGPPRNFKLRP